MGRTKSECGPLKNGSAIVVVMSAEDGSEIMIMNDGYLVPLSTLKVDLPAPAQPLQPVSSCRGTARFRFMNQTVRDPRNTGDLRS